MFARMHSEVTIKHIDVIHPKEGLQIFAHLLEQNPTQLAVVGANWRQLPPLPLLSNLTAGQADHIDHIREQDPSAEANTILLELLLADPSERQAMMETQLAQMVARVLQLDAARLEVRKPLSTLGMDSLMAVELREKIKHYLGLNVSMATLFTASVRQIAEQLTEELEEDDDRLGELLAEIEELSMDEVEALLQA